ncbi:MAG: zeta toxin family protein [Bacteroidetes bacterium]|nr:zeta toxin family protein [Bacteroidota bacterium]
MTFKLKKKALFTEKPAVKRLRIFADPNGSGKSTLYHEVKLYLGSKIGVWVNADEIQRELNNEFKLSFLQYELVVLQEMFTRFVSQLSRKFEINRFQIQDNVLYVVDRAVTDAYHASMIAEFIRESLLQQNKSIAFETVMSHPSKIDWMRKAQTMGYRVYLYYVTTDSVKIQKDRVRLRVLQNGHSVDEDKIESRYYRSLALLSDAMAVSTRAWLLDNSEVSGSMKLIAEMREDQFLELKSDFFPEWFWHYVVRKLT